MLAGECDIRVIVGKKDITPLVTSVEWNGHIDSPARQLNISLINTYDGHSQAISIALGTPVEFFNDSKRLFAGVLFAKTVDFKGSMQLTAYDNAIYLTKNDDVRVVKNMTASALLKRLCADFAVPVGYIADTGYVIPSLVLKTGQSLAEIMKYALTVTKKQTGKQYLIGSKDGRITLTSVADTKKLHVVNVTGASYTLSAEETRTQVKVEGGETKKRYSAIKKDAKTANVVGVMQHYEQMDEKASKSQIEQRALQLLKDLAKYDDQASVEALGIDEVITGKGIYVAEPMTRIMGGYYVSEDTHIFSGRTHTMSLTLTATLELPTVEITKEVLGIDKS